MLQKFDVRSEPARPRGRALAYVVVLLAGCAGTQRSPAPDPPQWATRLERRIATIDDAFDGALGVYIRDLASGTVVDHDADRPFYLASTVKLVVLTASYVALEEGHLQLDQEVTVRADHLRDGSRLFRTAPPGSRVTIDRLLSMMIEHSDNGATDILVEVLGLDAVNDVLPDLRLPPASITSLLDVRREVYAQLDPKARTLTPEQVFDVWAQRSMRRRSQRLGELLRADPKAWDSADLERAYDRYYATGLNSAPLRTMGILLERLASKDLVSERGSDAMLERLRRCATGRSRLKAGLPPDIPLAHKTGTQHHRACNLGIAYLAPDHPVVLAVCAERFAHQREADAAISAVARATYDALRTTEVLPISARHR